MSEKIDLGESIVVLGSGLNGTLISERFIEANKKVVMIDFGLEKNSELLNSSDFNDPLNLSFSPKYKIQEKAFSFAGFNKLMRIKTKNFFSIGSLAKGGLSNIWGGGLEMIEKEDFSNFPYSKEEIMPFFKKVIKRITGQDLNKIINPKDSKVKEILDKNRLRELENKVDPDNDGFRELIPLIAINFTKNLSNLNNFKKNNEIFNASDSLYNLIKLDNFEYLERNFIEKIIKKEDSYEIHTSDLKNKEKRIYEAKYIFSCLGPLSTTKIVAEMENFSGKLKLFNTPSFRFFGITRNSDSKNRIFFGLPFLNFSIKNENNNFSGAIFKLNSQIFDLFLMLKFLPKFLKNLLDNYIFKFFFVGNFYCSSDFSDNTISIKNEDYFIEGKKFKINEEPIPKVLSLLKNSLRSKGFYVIKLKASIPGSDVHYGGTIPISQEPKCMQCDLNGCLKNHINFYITDSSSLNFLPGKGNTALSLSQSLLIVEKFIERDLAD